MTGRHVREAVIAAFLGLMAGVTFHFVTGTDLAAGQSVDPLPRLELENRLSRSVMRADVIACDVHRQGTVTILDTGGISQRPPISEASEDPASRGRVLVTNAHVVQGASSATLSGARLGVMESAVDDFVDKRDAATLDTSLVPEGSGAGLEPGPTPHEGDSVVLAGFPEGRWTTYDATVRSIELRSGWGATSEVMVLDVAIEQGISGGVVVDLQGRAVGLIAARDPGTAHAVAYPIGDILSAEVADSPGC
ncbi:MAG: trypsin-like peptidase domain-containing protein [Microthrixaceae bacterium]